MEDRLQTFDVVEVFTFVKQTIKERNILVLTKPPKLVYSGLKTKVGTPKDYADNLKEKVFEGECPRDKIAIPQHILSKSAIANGQDE